MKIILLVLGVPILLAVGYVFMVFFNMVFIENITDNKLRFSPEEVPLISEITISEISNNEKTLPYEYKPGTGDQPGSQTMVLLEDGTIEARQRTFDSDPGKEVDVLISEIDLTTLVFHKNDIFEFNNYHLGRKVGEFSDPKLKFVRHVMPVNDRYVLVNGDREEAQYAEPYLWQVDRNSLEKTLLTKEPYYSFERPPKIFVADGFNGVVIVYYTGEYSYGFGGDSSRPEYSVIRVYNESFPDGMDVAKFDFKAGTIITVEWENNGLKLTGDPSKPGGEEKNRKPARVWQISFNEKNDVL